MWLAFYNEKSVGDILLLTRGEAEYPHIESETNDIVTIVKDTKKDKIVSINIDNISAYVNIEADGQVFLSEDDVVKINQLINNAGFDIEIEIDDSPKFVVGHVEVCEDHEDSDHLSITQTNVGDEVLQIVCGASNIDSDMDVIVAKPGAVLPSGLIIWPGELRGVESHGMICSTRELELTDIEDLPGIWELTESFQPGTPLNKVVETYK